MTTRPRSVYPTSGACFVLVSKVCRDVVLDGTDIRIVGAPDKYNTEFPGETSQPTTLYHY